MTAATALRLPRLVPPNREQADAFAQFGLRVMYPSGRGVPQDDVEAVAWFRAAARRDAFARFGFGVMYASRQARFR